LKDRKLYTGVEGKKKKQKACASDLNDPKHQNEIF